MEAKAETEAETEAEAEVEVEVEVEAAAEADVEVRARAGGSVGVEARAGALAVGPALIREAAGRTAAPLMTRSWRFDSLMTRSWRWWRFVPRCSRGGPRRRCAPRRSAPCQRAKADPRLVLMRRLG